jgi:hypothetical protein
MFWMSSLPIKGNRMMTIPHVLDMKEIIPTSRRANNCGGHMFNRASDVHSSHASNTNTNHGWKITSK